jgi:5-methylcytosine-specific restriction endonuclease McrA
MYLLGLSDMFDISIAFLSNGVHIVSCEQQRAATREQKMSSSWISKSVRQAIYNRDNRTCVYCGAVESEETVLSLDHVVARSIAPELLREPTNLITACCHCNSAKQTMTVPQFQRYLAAHYDIVTVKHLSAKVRRMAAKPL